VGLRVFENGDDPAVESMMGTIVICQSSDDDKEDVDIPVPAI
jgi:hypothetical protein